MAIMYKTFVAAREDHPGKTWLARFVAGRTEAANWYLGGAAATPPTVEECRAAIHKHMPELLPDYDRVCVLVGDDQMGRRILSHYRPAPESSGCSQAVWLGGNGPALVRNYDYPLDIVTGRIELTSWSDFRVISTAQRPWGGCLDGMNEEGLVASLTFGGSRKQGLGFSIILVIRYILETCHDVEQAIAALCRIPVALAQNVTVLDRWGAYATLLLSPGRTPVVTRQTACTNHQAKDDASSESLERQHILQSTLDEQHMSLEELTRRFFEPPLYSRRMASPTVYTAVYRPAERRVDYIWPGKVWRQSFDQFEPGQYRHDYGELAP